MLRRAVLFLFLFAVSARGIQLVPEVGYTAMRPKVGGTPSDEPYATTLWSLGAYFTSPRHERPGKTWRGWDVGGGVMGMSSRNEELPRHSAFELRGRYQNDRFIPVAAEIGYGWARGQLPDGDYSQGNTLAFSLAFPLFAESLQYKLEHRMFSSISNAESEKIDVSYTGMFIGYRF